MQVGLAIEGGFVGNSATELVVLEGPINICLILMDVDGRQVAVKFTPSQAELLAERFAAFAK